MKLLNSCFRDAGFYGDLSEEIGSTSKRRSRICCGWDVPEQEAAYAAHRECGSVMRKRGRRNVWRLGGEEDFFTESEFCAADGSGKNPRIYCDLPCFTAGAGASQLTGSYHVQFLEFVWM